MKKLLLAFTLVLTLSLAGCSQKDLTPEEQLVKNKEKFAESYGLESADHVFETIALEDVESVVGDKERVMVYFGSPI